jgi:N-acetylglucosaminyl-diphospho-decaprenol L-rhamnosyltransferase
MASDAHDDLDVVVVNWNTGGYLGECLASVYESSAPVRLGKVVVVDNASSDDSLGRAEPWLSRASSVLVHNAENRGFAAACNQGARAGAAPFVLFLNPDARVLDTAIVQVVDFLRSPGGRSVGICGGQVLDPAGRPTVSGGPFPSVRLLLGQVSGLSRVLPALFPAKHVTVTATGPVDHVIGAFLVVRRELFEQLGGFDEGFFMYYEEVDLCLRARELGWATYHLADAKVVHVGNLSTDKVRAKRLAYSLTSRRRYAQLHWGPRDNALLTLLTFTVELVARVLSEAARRRAIPTETLRGYALFARRAACRSTDLA